MYFLTYNYNKKTETGLMDNDKNNIIPLKNIFNKLDLDFHGDLNSLIDIFNKDLFEQISEIIKNWDGKLIPLDDVKLCAPIPYPKRNLICLGKNYLDHAKETMGLKGSEDNIPKYPIYFNKSANPAIGDGDIILNHRDITNMIDYEVELAIVIGKDGINIPKEDAEDYIFGYTIVNDISARNIQRKHGQWFKGKSLETFCPMGPFLVHKSQIPFPVELNLICKINSEIRQDSNTKNLIFDIPYIISDLSKGMYLRKGDIIATGTPSGVGLGFKPFKFLKSGDLIECTIEKIGTLSNKMA